MISISTWIKSSMGTPVSLYSSHPLEEQTKLRPLILMGGVHGDEPLGVYLAEQTLKLLAGPLASESVVPWILIPCLNPDGYKAGTRVNGRGVDLNRNYPSKSWSPVAEKERYYPGPNPASEAETQGVVRLIREMKPRLIIHCHSWEPMIVCAGEPGLKDAGRLAESSGYIVKPEIGYPTPGSLSQFGWWDNQIPVICIEESDHASVESVWPRFEKGMREIFLDVGAR